MPDFRITTEAITKIADDYKLSFEFVSDLHNIYKQKISDTMKFHYLAHVIRAMEDTLRQIPGNEMFRIECKPIAIESKDIGIAGSYYYKGRFFAIHYHPNTKEKQLRIMLAHELGHLFLVELFNANTGANLTEKTKIEPISTILGIFTIFDKNEFYHNKLVPYRHTSPEEVLHDFKQLANREKKYYNIS